MLRPLPVPAALELSFPANFGSLQLQPARRAAFAPVQRFRVLPVYRAGLPAAHPMKRRNRSVLAGLFSAPPRQLLLHRRALYFPDRSPGLLGTPPCPHRFQLGLQSKCSRLGRFCPETTGDSPHRVLCRHPIVGGHPAVPARLPQVCLCPPAVHLPHL